MSNIGSYDERIRGFNWKTAEEELGYSEGDVINIGWFCSDRICEKGHGQKTALLWEGLGGKEKSFTYDEIRLASDTIGTYLRDLGISDGDRVCLFMDKIPELYLGFLGILKIGAIAQPLFSAFGDESLAIRLENAESAAILPAELAEILEIFLAVQQGELPGLSGNVRIHPTLFGGGVDRRRPVVGPLAVRIKEFAPKGIEFP